MNFSKLYYVRFLVLLIAIIAVAFCYGYSRLLMSELLTKSIGGFRVQNLDIISEKDTLGLSQKLGQSFRQSEWKCASLRVKGRAVLDLGGGNCEGPLIYRSSVSLDDEGSILLEVSAGLPRAIMLSLLVVVLSQLCLFVVSIHLIRFYEQSSNQTRLRLGGMVAEIIHDLRTPLLVLKSVCGRVTYRSREDEGAFLSALSRVEMMSADLLRGFRGLSSNLDTVDLRELVESSIKEKKYLYRGGLTFEVPYSVEGPVLVKAERSSVVRVVSNLIDNAFESTDGGLRVKLNVSKRVVNLVFENKGIFRKQKRINDAWAWVGFSKIDEGLGLDYVKREVKSWGGAMDIVSSHGKTSVRLLLPIHCS